MRHSFLKLVFLTLPCLHKWCFQYLRYVYAWYGTTCLVIVTLCPLVMCPITLRPGVVFIFSHFCFPLTFITGLYINLILNKQLYIYNYIWFDHDPKIISCLTPPDKKKRVRKFTISLFICSLGIRSTTINTWIAHTLYLHFVNNSIHIYFTCYLLCLPIWGSTFIIVGSTLYYKCYPCDSVLSYPSDWGYNMIRVLMTLELIVPSHISTVLRISNPFEYRIIAISIRSRINYTTVSKMLFYRGRLRPTWVIYTIAINNKTCLIDMNQCHVSYMTMN